MRMPAHHLLADSLDDGKYIEGPFFLAETSKKDNLKQKVSQFLLQFFAGIVVNSFQNLICLFHQVAFQLFLSLFFIPGASVLAPEFSHDLDQPYKAVGLFLHLSLLKME